MTIKAAFSLDAAATTRLKARIAHKAGTKMREIVTELHQRILDRTAFNSGRTLGSWAGAAGRPMLVDVGESGGFGYSTDFPNTNDLPVGAEPNRKIFESASLKTTETIPFEKKPYQIFFVANGASLDSGDGIGPLQSDLWQGPGSRAAAQEYGTIAAFDVFESVGSKKVFSFSPRGTNAVKIAVESIRRDYGRV